MQVTASGRKKRSRIFRMHSVEIPTQIAAIVQWLLRKRARVKRGQCISALTSGNQQGRRYFMGGSCRLEVGLQVAVSFPCADITYVGAEAISESCRALARVLGRVLVVALFLILPEVLSAQVPTVTCSSTPGNRQECAADTSKGVVLAKSTGESPCLLGKSWGYDDRSIWVSDGCSGEFVAGQAIQEATERKGRH